MHQTTILFRLFAFITIVFSAVISCNEADLSDTFVVKDISEIRKVIIQQDSRSLKIEQDIDETRWIINDKYPADQKSIKKLLQAFTSMKIDKPVPAELKDSVTNAIQNTGKTITLYNRRDKVLKEFKIGEFIETSGGTYMIESESQTPCIVTIPGLENNLNKRFSLQYIYWIEPLLFSYEPGEIKEITLHYQSEPKRSFSISINGSDAHLLKIDTKKEISPLNHQKIGNYLSYFMNVKFADIHQSDQTRIDSLSKTEARFILSVKDLNGKIKNVKFYDIPDKNNPNTFDLNKMNALINDEDYVTVSYYDIDLLLKDIEYFTN
jgi:hypothetical protein